MNIEDIMGEITRVFTRRSTVARIYITAGTLRGAVRSRRIDRRLEEVRIHPDDWWNMVYDYSLEHEQETADDAAPMTLYGVAIVLGYPLQDRAQNAVSHFCRP